MRSSGKRSRKGITAWLVTWQWVGDHAKPERKIAAILNPHWSPDRVREYVEFMYVNSHYSISERIAYAKNRSFNPYPAKFACVNDIPWNGQITCGHNPWLFARLVDNLAATGEPDDEEKVVWTERPKPNFDKISRELGIHQDERT
jgi:hypothetical protein